MKNLTVDIICAYITNNFFWHNVSQIEFTEDAL